MRHRAFRPAVVALDSRMLPSSVAFVGPSPAPAHYADAASLGLHESYVAEARGGAGRVVFLGDSITFFWGTGDRVAAGSARWNATFAPLGAQNFGIIGDRADDLLWRVEDGELAGKPRVAVVMVGVNDIIHGDKPAETAGRIGALARAIGRESPRTRVLLVGILPTASPEYNLKASRINALVARQVKGPRVQAIDVGRKFLGADGRIAPRLYDGGVHPGAAGYEVLARALLPPVLRLLRA